MSSANAHLTAEGRRLLAKGYGWDHREDWRRCYVPEPKRVRRCALCGCELLSSNATNTCSPCSIGEVEPSWNMLVLGSLLETEEPTVWDRLGRVVRGMDRTRLEQVRQTQALHDEWLRLNEQGMSMRKIGELYGRRHTTVQQALVEARKRRDA